MNFAAGKPTNPVGRAQRSYSVSLIRLIALLSIIACHVLMYLNIALSDWLNTGVQIFLCISGFLYGQKDIGETTQFYKKRLQKIAIPYYIVFLTACILQFLFARDALNLKRVALGLICRGEIRGGEHLWFVPYILLCYLLTPLLQANRCRAKDARSMWSLAGFSAAICAVWFTLFNKAFIAAWMVCYVLGYMLGVNEKGQYVKNRLLLAALGSTAVIGNGLQIYCSYIAHTAFRGYHVLCEFNHTFLGVFLFLLLKTIFDRVPLPKKAEKLLDAADRYSYETYLVHQFFILGPFTLMALTPFTGWNVVIIVLCILFSARLTKKAESFVEGKLRRIT